MDLWKKSKLGRLKAPEIQVIFSNFHHIFTNFDNIFKMFTLPIDFGRLNLPIETKFYKKK